MIMEPPAARREMDAGGPGGNAGAVAGAILLASMIGPYQTPATADAAPT